MKYFTVNVCVLVHMYPETESPSHTRFAVHEPHKPISEIAQAPIGLKVLRYATAQ